MRKPIAAIWMTAALGCGGGGTSGEPARGTATFEHEGDGGTIAVGAAFQDPDYPGEMTVMFGTDNVDCGSDPNDPGKGLSASANAPDSMPSTNDAADFLVSKVESRSAHYLSTDGTLTVDALGDRVTGSVQVSTTTDDGTISVSGTFDVKRCF